jgi:hypothetical protein
MFLTSPIYLIVMFVLISYSVKIAIKYFGCLDCLSLLKFHIKMAKKL